MTSIESENHTNAARSNNFVDAEVSQSSDSISGSQQSDAHNTDNLRGGSSPFAFPAEDIDCAYDQSERCEPGVLIVDFPERDCDQYGYSHKRSYDDDDNDNRKQTGIPNGNYTTQDLRQLFKSSSAPTSGSRNTTKPTRLGEAARMEQLAAQNMPGGKNYRPLVGGFAAAAYEAMKEHHYSDRTINCDTSEASDTER
mmetsp:Transcript_2448/g.2653  ORF Transcript_2448/g.2653 Transcript_2448/m.2653 type:complete len:197 (-) Transcript_2448:237-827(-)|eukprot:CAMPEP_0198265056 /NCGR_PEP_ID=MMETSP1447-20131203/19959_1 /TAXON_ID=420782 /ORGANISM="Chaetoceros dichaeta, Strain CCMP1751" /LENGTH=196 /DNA_ID=CAMNT_0043954305 /DNA_START=111 /DNA_END=701 /DNA_ORIENTATION=-